MHQPDTIERLPIANLLPYARNSRTHSPEQVAAVAKSIEEFGFTNPVLIRQDGTIIAGHGRVMAARQLGLVDVPCIRLSHLTDEQARAYVIADNKLAELAGWDDALLALEFFELGNLGFDLELTGFTQEEIDALTPGGPDDKKKAGAPSGTGSLAARFLIPPFSVLNAREGWWQDRKRAWLALGIKSELGRGDKAPGGGGGGAWGHAGPSDKYQRGGADERPNLGQCGGDAARHTKPVPRAEPGGSARPATNYSKSKARGDGTGKAI